MTIHRQISTQTLKKLYDECGSCVEVGRRVGMSGGQVARRLRASGYQVGTPRWTADQLDRLQLEYQQYADRGKLLDLANEMGKTVAALRNMAQRMGLTDTARIGSGLKRRRTK